MACTDSVAHRWSLPVGTARVQSRLGLFQDWLSGLSDMRMDRTQGIKQVDVLNSMPA